VALYGRERVADVEAHSMFSTSDGEIEELGLEFQIATRLTSWVAVDESRVVKGPAREQLIPQELPYGTSAGAFGLRGIAQGEALDDVEFADLALQPRGMPAPAPAQAAPMAPPGGAMFGYAGGGAPRRSRSSSETTRGESTPVTRTASFDAGEEGGADDDLFESEAPTGEVRFEQSQLRAMPEQAEDKKVAPPRAAAQEPLPPPPRVSRILVAGKAPPPPAENRPAPAQPGHGGPQSMVPIPTKPSLEPMLPTQPVFPPLEQRAELERKRKARLRIALAILIAAIIALLVWLIA
jgi:Ca-activated chloride channel family protein